MKVKEGRQNRQGETRGEQELMHNSFSLKEPEALVECTLGLLVPVRRIFIFRELVVNIPLNVSAPHCQQTLHDPVLRYFPKSDTAQFCDDGSRASGLGLVGEQRVKDLGSGDWFPSAIHSVEDLPQKAFIVPLDNIGRNPVVTQSPT
ncbi:RNA polymerase sigma-70 factor [Janibacter sp. HTCC2649]|nr:RNA polymerase sigma-70 factor [Janibacter sp. HTCC2649]